MTDTRPRCPVDIDLVDPDTFENGLPLEAFAAMRDQAPVFWHEQPGTWGEGFWVVTRHADVMEVSRQADIFSSYERGALLSVGGQDEEQSLQMTRLLMLNMDPPEHTRHRALMNPAFTTRFMAAYLPLMQRIIAARSATWVGHAEIDLMAEAREIAFDVAAAALVGMRTGPQWASATNSAPNSWNSSKNVVHPPPE